MSTRHVLIVDDLRDIRQLLRSSLESLNLAINIVDVPSGEEAMLVITRQKYDLLVSDVRLAGISGLDLVRKVRKGNPNLKVILITGMPDSEIRQQVAEFGADKYFFKPIDIIDFQKAVVSFLDLDSVQLPEVPAVPAVPAEPAPRVMGLPDRLSHLRQELEAACVWVASPSGKTVIQVGEQPESWSQLDLRSTISATGSASLELARALQREFPENYFCISGHDNDLHGVSLGWMYTLLAAVPRRAEAAQPSPMQLMVRQSVDILNALAEYLPSTAPESGALPAESSRIDNEPVDTGQLDEVFEQGGGNKMDDQEIDEFWDNLTDEQQLKEKPESGALSYEQARKLGLTPGE
jgi:CheY-like chemotaxis protein